MILGLHRSQQLVMLKMQKEHYIEPAALENLPELLANTYDVALPNPEQIETIADLRTFLESASLPTEATLSMDDLAAVHEVRQQVRAVFLAKSMDEAVNCINLLLSEIRPELIIRPVQNGVSLQLAPIVSDKVAKNLRSVVAIALAQSVERLGFDRLRACEADPCRDLFIDRSKKGAKRFCGPKCASRTHVSAFRSRRAL
jgi:predicted RNA-binding Zn ribbon-like protein